jgi:hypothetical protein
LDNSETTTNKIYEPYYKITTIKELFLFTIRICFMLENDEIKENDINQTILVNNILRIDCNWNSDSIIGLSKNLNLCVLGNCFIVIDEALDSVFGDKPKVYTDTDIDALRAIIYMLRCAIAHNPTAPVWNAKGAYNKDFKIKEIGYELKTKQLDGKTLNHSHYGNITGVMSLINYSLKVVKEYSEETTTKIE